MLKKERQQLAKDITALCQEHGYSFTMDPIYVHGRDAGITLNIDCGEVKAMVRLNHREFYSVNWYDANRQLSSWTFGDVNAYHGTKATSFCAGGDQLLTFFKTTFTKIKSGKAFI